MFSEGAFTPDPNTYAFTFSFMKLTTMIEKTPKVKNPMNHHQTSVSKGSKALSNIEYGGNLETISN
jgi:hypothetical protein